MRDPEIIPEPQGAEDRVKKETITIATRTAGAARPPCSINARESWYIRTTSFARRMIELNSRSPGSLGSG